MSDKTIEAIESLPVLVVCPICNDTTMAKDLHTLDETIHKMWQLSKEWMKEFFGEQSTVEAIATAGLHNKKERQIEIIKEQGFLKIMCRTCMTDESKKQYEQLGMSFVRIGNMLFETKFYKNNRKMIQEEMKAKPQLFKKTFWT